jgi:hypothetical protein
MMQARWFFTLSCLDFIPTLQTVSEIMRIKEYSWTSGVDYTRAIKYTTWVIYNNLDHNLVCISTADRTELLN